MAFYSDVFEFNQSTGRGGTRIAIEFCQSKFGITSIALHIQLTLTS